MTEETDWQALIQKHLDGLTSDRESATLSDEIVKDATIRAEYLRAARVHGALGDETLALDLDPITEPKKDAASRPATRPHQIAAALFGGALIKLVGVGVAWSINAPKS